MATSPVNRIDFYKEAYYKEIEVKSSLNNEITLQGTVITALLSATFYLATNFESPYKIVKSVFLLLCIITFGFLGYAGYQLFKSYYNFKKSGRIYKYLPKMHDIENEYYNVSQNDTRFEIYLIGILTKARDNNANHNKEKSELLTKSSKWMAVSFVCASSIILVYLLNLLVTPYLPSNQFINTKKSTKIQHHEQPIRNATAHPTNPTAITPVSAGTLNNKTERGRPQINRLRREKRKT